MKGLIRNNFYSLGDSFKVVILVYVILLFIITIMLYHLPSYDSFVYAFTPAIFGSVGQFVVVTLKKNSISKWNKFELTMPVSRCDVIKAQYISSLMCIFVATIMAILSSFVIYILGSSKDLDILVDLFNFGISFAILISTFTIPLVIIFGTNKVEILNMIAVILALGLYVCAGTILNRFLGDILNSNKIIAICSFILFVLSYFISVYFYKRKDL